MTCRPCCWSPMSILCLALALPRVASAQEEEAPEEAAQTPSDPGGAGEGEARPAAPVPAAPDVPDEPSEQPPVETSDSSATDGGVQTDEGGEVDQFYGTPTSEPVPDPGGDRDLEEGGTAGGSEDVTSTEGRSSVCCPFFDVEETDPVFAIRRGPVSVGVVGSLQLLGVPFIQDPWASLESGSIANVEGFRLRRARFGIVGSLADWLSLELRVELEEDGADILDASITFEPHHLARITAGALKVPFSRIMMLGSEYQSFLQRPNKASSNKIIAKPSFRCVKAPLPTMHRHVLHSAQLPLARRSWCPRFFVPCLERLRRIS